ncbi:hypothetical protein Syun_003272 [Stephania yunnanensis]|uniref:Uncharacterized protein n=1 Tax=Stephania yunnanensis TaxID=152371 RepID=A0AAP0Q0G8_9MAGN
MDGDRLDLVTVAANLRLTWKRLWSLLRNKGSIAIAVAVLRGLLLRLDQCYSRNSSKQDKLKEIGVANRDLTESYVAVFSFKEASSHCAKGLDIHKAQLGDNSVKVAMIGVSLVSSIRVRRAP